MLKNILKSLFENIYNPKIDLEQYIATFVSKDYIQVVDGHKINYIDFIEHIKKQREILESISFNFICLVEEGDTVASLHRVYAKKGNKQEVIAEVHAFFKFKDKMLISCDERTRIIQGSDEDKDLGRRK
ncbi:nuclear transport factor 2 family protein [Francisella sp. LA112445]|uniref:nuclear transport factor 2 family protein n=1 Tax=Francisella sp. LA112445 TaxID=1395624 RepID=UPI001788D54D|nr:nuclear transport factor 2 family protein [Francisella sp. LA112445]QIW09296.1 nuclear transport factor 2 family protein [Francisella sp. LA112445]